MAFVYDKFVEMFNEADGVWAKTFPGKVIKRYVSSWSLLVLDGEYSTTVYLVRMYNSH